MSSLSISFVFLLNRIGDFQIDYRLCCSRRLSWNLHQDFEKWLPLNQRMCREQCLFERINRSVAGTIMLLMVMHMIPMQQQQQRRIPPIQAMNRTAHMPLLLLMMDMPLPVRTTRVHRPVRPIPPLILIQVIQRLLTLIQLLRLLRHYHPRPRLVKQLTRTTRDALLHPQCQQPTSILITNQRQ